MASKRILITGASGFIGRQAVLALRGTKDEIHTVQHTARQMSDSRNHTANLLDPEQIDRLIERVKPTHLLHLAWYAEHGKYWTSALNLDWVSASLKLFQAFTAGGGKRAVFAGTCAEYDWAAVSPLHETRSPSNPSTLYGICKNSLRQIVEKFAAQSSVSFAWGRIFFLYGPNEHPNRLVPSIVNPLLKDQPATVLSGAHVRNLMHVQDVARAFVHLLDSDVTGTVNIADRESITLGDVAQLLGELTGKSHLLRIQEGEGTLQNPRMLTADTDRLYSLGFTANYPLRQGLLDLVKESS
jgi:nucleoside-diphosphate-sugar epimerase